MVNVKCSTTNLEIYKSDNYYTRKHLSGIEIYFSALVSASSSFPPRENLLAFGLKRKY